MMAVLVKDRDAAQLTAGPFRLVLFEFGVDGFEERAHERDLERRSNDGALQPDVLDCEIKNTRQRSVVQSRDG